MNLQYFLLPPLLLFSATVVVSQNIVRTLPGFSGELPLSLKLGEYVSVGDIELFYYFVESQCNPGADPLILYINGGPGCSGLNGFVYQVGPVAFNTTDYTGGLPTLLLYPHSWTKTANIIFLDAPVGTGFSYATTNQAYTTSDTLSWLNDHLDFKSNPFFLGTDSYSGIPPIIAQEIIDGNEVGEEPTLISKIVYAHRMALISDSLYEAAKTSCNGRYVDVDPQCKILQDILEPNCAFLTPKQNKEIRRSLQENSKVSSFHHITQLVMLEFQYLLSDIWTNYKSVQEALYVRPGTVKEFFRCNISLSYTVNVNNVIGYHKNLTNSGLQVLQWIKSLNISIDSDWRPWYVVKAKYTRKYTNNGYRLTYSTIKGAGHSPPEYKRKECYEMFYRWIRYYPL
ncbi:hypothetical protein AAG906_021650 [Vitis piasezkii]